MLTATRSQTTALLNSDDRTKIADILTWDLCKPVTPEEIEAIRVDGEWVEVQLSFHRAVPIHREVFRSIMQQQQTPVH